ncbi:isoprenoid synthase domain-containing protein [Mycena crocata]|nr:isoprenoid synthase domain-containing protein [Mycena crocata]
MPGTASVQLPVLVGLTRAYTLRTNRHCHATTSASEQWFMTQQNLLTEEERGTLRSMKIGLWAAVCFPTCDPPQLRLATDFLTALSVYNTRQARARTMRDFGWNGETASLAENDLFRHIIPQITSAMPSERSREGFLASCGAFVAAQTQLLAHRQNNTLPSTEAYKALRRDLSGTPMLFPLIEMAEGLNINLESDARTTLQQCAADVVALALDILAYNNDQSISNNFNIVSVIQADTGVSAQGAIGAAFALIRQSFQTFEATESALLSLEQPSSESSTSAWVWNPLARLKSPPAKSPGTSPEATPTTPDSKLYLAGLKDVIVGTLNWGYETELYLGLKGDEVRQFGWVFLKARDGDGTEEQE